MSLSSDETLKKVLNILSDAKSRIDDLLTGTVYESMTLLGLRSSIDKMINQVSHIGGLTIPGNVVVDFPPVTEFMGEKIERPKELRLEDLEPAEREKRIFISKVDKLYAAFDTIAPEGILNSYTLPEDQLVIRGVAKRAGVAGYEDATINLFFLEKIAKGIQQKRANELEDSRVQNDLKKQQNIVQLRSRLTEVEAKQKQLIVDKDQAVEELAKATTDASTKKAKVKVDGIDAEIVAAQELQISLQQQLNALQS